MCRLAVLERHWRPSFGVLPSSYKLEINKRHRTVPPCSPEMDGVHVSVINQHPTRCSGDQLSLVKCDVMETKVGAVAGSGMLKRRLLSLRSYDASVPTVSWPTVYTSER